MDADRWHPRTLGGTVNLKRGYDLPKRLRESGPFPIVSSSGVTGSHAEAKVDPPGVVTGRYGTIGTVFYVDEPYWPLNTTLYVEDFKGNHERFIAYLLESLNLGALVSSAAVPGINRNHLHPLPVLVPDRQLQESIATTLGAFDDLIENSRRRTKILEQMARLLYREWFVHFRFPGCENLKLIDSDLGPIPKSWSQTRLADEVKLQRLNIKPFEHAKEKFDHYSIPAFDESRLPTLEAGAEIKSGKYLLTDESVMISKLNPRFRRVWRVDQPGLGRRAVASTEFMVLTKPFRWPLPFIYGLLASDDITDRLANMAGGTSTSHQRARPTEVMNMAVLCPPLELVQKYTDEIRPTLKLVDNLLQQVAILQQARDLLLPRLVSGELDLSQLDLGREQAEL